MKLLSRHSRKTKKVISEYYKGHVSLDELSGYLDHMVQQGLIHKSEKISIIRNAIKRSEKKLLSPFKKV